MPPPVAALCFAVGIAGLFWLNRDRSVRTSRALWLAVGWLSIVGSRNVGEWFGTGARLDPGSAYMEGSSLDRNVLTSLLAAGVATLLHRRRQVGAVLRANPAVLTYFLYCGLSILWSDYPIVGVKRWFRSLGDLVMVLVILTDRNPAAAYQRVLTRVGFLLLPMSILLIRYFPEYGRAYIPWSGAVTWTGVAGGKNGLGMTSLIYGLAATWCFLAAWQKYDHRVRLKGRLLAQGIVAGTAVYLLWLADSKTSLACFVLAGCLMAVLAFRSFARRPVILHLTVLVLVFTPFSVMFLGVGGSSLEAIGRDSTLTGRTDIWDVVLRYVDHPLLGAGYENFWLGKRLAAIAREHGVFFTQAHNGYLEIYLNLGWVGLALLGLLIVTGYPRIAGALRRGSHLGSLTLAYFVVALVYNFTEGAFKMMSSVWIAFLLAIMAPTCLDLNEPRACTTHGGLRRLRNAVPVAAAS